MTIEGTHRAVTLEYPVLCAHCQKEIPAGEAHDLKSASEGNRPVYWHRHDACAKPPPKAEKASDSGELVDGEALAVMGATFLVAGASYLLGRWKQQKTLKG